MMAWVCKACRDLRLIDPKLVSLVLVLVSKASVMVDSLGSSAALLAKSFG